MAIAADPSRQYAELFIGGEWIAPHSGRTIASIDPSTENVWALVAEADAVDIDRAVDAARDALRGPWSRLTPSARGALLHALGTLIARDARALAEIESRDNGKPLPFVKPRIVSSETGNLLQSFRAAQEHLRAWNKSCRSEERAAVGATCLTVSGDAAYLGHAGPGARSRPRRAAHTWRLRRPPLGAYAARCKDIREEGIRFCRAGFEPARAGQQPRANG